MWYDSDVGLFSIGREKAAVEEEELLKKRFRELADKAYQSNSYTFTGFLGLSEMACFYELEKELAFIPYTVFGGNGNCERVMLRFGSEELFGYEEGFPIVCVKIKPLMQKFADNLGHRDFLGALMNLGIERNTLGDILLKDNQGYLFCIKSMAPFIVENLRKIKHTSVFCEITQDFPAEREEELKEMKIQVSSERIDGVIARVHRLSRSESAEYFRQKKVFVNGRLCENNSYLLRESDVVTVRGLGKFIFKGQAGFSKKGKLNAAVLMYGAG